MLTIKYTIRGFKWNFPSAFDVASVIFFVLLLPSMFENKRQTEMKLKGSVKLTEQNNYGNAHS